MYRFSLSILVGLNQLNYQHLMYFRTVAREGSINKACKLLYLTQPTINAQLRSLEKAAGASCSTESAGTGLFVIPIVVEARVKQQYRSGYWAESSRLGSAFLAISVERRLKHPAVIALTDAARQRLWQAVHAVRRGIPDETGVGPRQSKRTGLCEVA